MIVSICALIISLVALAVSVTTLVLARGGGALRAEARLKQVISAPKYVGSSDDLKKALIDMDRRGKLTVRPQPVLPNTGRKE